MHVGIHGAHAQEELLRDLRVAPPAGEEAEDLALPAGEGLDYRLPLARLVRGEVAATSLGPLLLAGWAPEQPRGEVRV